MLVALEMEEAQVRFRYPILHSQSPLDQGVPPWAAWVRPPSLPREMAAVLQALEPLEQQELLRQQARWWHSPSAAFGSAYLAFLLSDFVD